jgi:hypothetical protein
LAASSQLNQSLIVISAIPRVQSIVQCNIMMEKKQRIMVEKRQRSRRTRARENSPLSLVSADTRNSEESSIFEMIASTLFYVGSVESHPDEPSKTSAQVKAIEEESSNICSCQDVGSFYFYGNLPMQYVSILVSRSVNELELMLPHVLANMAAEYNRDNSTKVQSMMGDTSHRTEGDREFILMAKS